MDAVQRQAYLQTLGITPWVLRERLPLQHSPSEKVSMPEPREATDEALGELDWSRLRNRVAACTACGLHQTRTHTVFGAGDENARLMIVGEAPGAEEDRAGQPFVGRAGQLLSAMLLAIGFERQQVFIANILKCRPPGNRNPAVEEAAACMPFIKQQIELVQPKVILALGAVAAHHLLETEEAVGRLRKRTHQYGPARRPLMVTYHPAYLLRRPEEKAKVWDDLQRLYALL